MTEVDALNSGNMTTLDNEAEIKEKMASKISLFKKGISIDRDFYRRFITYLACRSWKKPQAAYKNYQKKEYIRQMSLVEKSWFLTSKINVLIRLHETAEFLRTMTNSEGYYIYIITEDMEEIFIFPKDWSCFYGLRYKWSIRKGDTIACFVMRTRQSVITDTREIDLRFLKGQDIPGLDSTSYVLAVPLVNFGGHAVGVLELYRESEVPYEQEFLEYVSVMAKVAAETITQNKKKVTYSSMLEDCPSLSSKLNEAMTAEPHEPLNPYYATVMEYMKKATDAQKVSVFIVKDGKLVEEINTDILEGSNRPTLAKELKIANLSLSSGWILNIIDLFSDLRFDITEELDTGHIIRSVLNLPLGRRKCTVGVLQAINKLSGGNSFSASGELVSTCFSSFCALWYYYNEIVDRAIRLNKSWSIYANNLYSIISRPFPSLELVDIDDLTVSPVLKSFNFKLPELDELPKLILIMIQDIAGKEIFDPKELYNFINMTTVFSGEYFQGLKISTEAVQFLFVILNIYSSLFSHEEQISLIMAVFCATIIQQYPSIEKLTKNDDPILYIFNDYFIQRNAFRSAKFLIKSSNLLKNLSDKQQEDFINSLEENILSTNHEISAKMFKKLRDLTIQKEFDYNNLEHQKLLKALIMFSSANHCHYANAAPSLREYFKDLYEEVMDITQGDEVDKPGDPEMQLKTLYAMTIKHMEKIVLPYCNLLTTILPNLSEAYTIMSNHCKILINIVHSEMDLAEAEDEFFK